jgi:hypothetical protein
MSRPHAGYTVNRKIKSAKKSIAHLNSLLKIVTEKKDDLDVALAEKLSNRIKFWESYVVKMTPDPKAPRTKK